MHALCKYMIAVLSFYIFFSGICLPIIAKADHDPVPDKKVLILNSYHHGFLWTDTIVNAIKRDLTSNISDIEIFVEYMDAKRVNHDPLFKSFKNFLMNKYHNNIPDVIICSDDAALSFLLDNRASLFPEIPIVFCGVNDITLVKSLHGNITGVVETLDIKDNLELITSLFPKTQYVICITDGTPTGKATRNDISDEAINFPQLSFKYYNGEELTMHELLEKLQQLPIDSVVLAPTWYKDKTGNSFSNLESYKLISLNSPVPVFVTSAANMGLGVFGGKVNSGRIQGSKAANLAIKILTDNDPGSYYHIDTTSQNDYIFDKTQLLRFGISESSLPENSLIVNRPFSFYKNYKYLVWGVISFITILFLTIALLFINIIKRRHIEKLLLKGEEALKESEQRLQLALGGADLGLWDWQIDTGEVFFNDQWATMLGYNGKELKHNIETWKSLLNPDDFEYTYNCINQHFEGKTDIYESTHRLRHKDGHWVWILDRGKVTEFDAEGKPLRACGTHLDVTEIKKMQEDLKRSADDLRTTLNSIGDGVIATDINGCITKMNPVAEKLTGISYKDAYGRHIGDVYRIIDAYTREKIESPVSKILKTAELVGMSRNVILLNNDANEYYISDSGSPIINDSGEVCGAVLVFHNTTEEHKIQEQLNQSQKMDAIGQLAGGVAHDFNNMLGCIIGASEIIQIAAEKDEVISSHVDLILGAANRASDLCSNLVVFARKNKLQKNYIDIAQVVKDSIRLLGHSLNKSIKISFTQTAQNTLVFCDLSQIENVFLNLGINAGHAMENGGEINFILSNIELDQNYCDISQFEVKPGPHIKIEVHDTGCGIHREHIEHIFEPFYTTRKNGKGTGLGLSTAYGIIQQHQGAITVYSEVGIGTSFNIVLPVSDQKVEISKPSHIPVLGSGTILVIDDEEILRKTSKSILNSLGYDVLLANNGKEGLKVYQENIGHIDLVLLDMIMPEMSGSECYYKIHKLTPDVPVIIASGFSHAKEVKLLNEDGLSGFIKKPYKRWELSQLIDRCLNK